MRKSLLTSWFLITVIILVFIVALHIFSNIERSDYKVFLEKPSRVDLKSVGEITAGKGFSQRIPNPFYDGEEGLETNSLVCLELLLANYMDRSNIGHIKVGMEFREGYRHKKVPVETVRDNQFHRVCFNGINIDALTDSEFIMVSVRGLDSPGGKAVTAWTTTDTTYGVVRPDSQFEEQRSLILRLGLSVPLSLGNLASMSVLAIISILSICVIVLSALMDRIRHERVRQ